MPDQPDDELVTLTHRELARIVHDGVRRVLWTALAAAILAALLITTIGGAIEAHQTRNDAIETSAQNARYDCQLVQALSGGVSDFIATDANVRVTQAKTPVTATLLHDLTRIIPLGDLEKLARQSAAASLATASHWQHVDLPPLQHLAGLDCTAALEGQAHRAERASPKRTQRP